MFGLFPLDECAGVHLACLPVVVVAVVDSDLFVPTKKYPAFVDLYSREAERKPLAESIGLLATVHLPVADFRDGDYEPSNRSDAKERHRYGTS